MSDPAGGWESIPAMAAAAADRFGDRPAIAEGDTRLSYAELFDEARTFGAALVSSGVGRGDRVAIWAPNSVEWVVAVLGLLQAGATLVPVNTRFKGVEAADILSRSRARALVTVTDFLDTDYVAMLDAARAEGAELADLETVVTARGPARDDAEPWGEFLGRATDQARAEVDRRRAGLGRDDPSDILFTSGTTGVPKGVVMTHGRTLGVGTDWVAMTGLSADDRYLMVNPYFHMFGLKAGIVASVAAGATMLPEPVFDVDRLLARAASERVTVLPGPPTLYQSILDHPDRGRHDLSSLRVAVTGAADIPVELIRRVDAELPFSAIITGYGLTEAGTASATSPADDAETIATTVGRPRPGFQVRIVAEGDRDVATGETGEVLLRGPTVMAGYLDDPEATARALSPDGWLRTGDLGLIDEGGCLHIVGRAKDMFIVGGFNAYPAEIENALLRHPDVRQAAVIGIPDDRLGEVGMAFVVIRPGAAASGPEIIDWSRDQMANYKVPRAVEVLDELPVNATGKVVKDELRARFLPGRPVSAT
jgi:acyl-CoA synthetase (AMP-forming)/AMP-acid ligase II